MHLVHCPGTGGLKHTSPPGAVSCGPTDNSPTVRAARTTPWPRDGKKLTSVDGSVRTHRIGSLLEWFVPRVPRGRMVFVEDVHLGSTVPSVRSVPDTRCATDVLSPIKLTALGCITPKRRQMPISLPWSGVVALRRSEIRVNPSRHLRVVQPRGRLPAVPQPTDDRPVHRTGPPSRGDPLAQWTEWFSAHQNLIRASQRLKNLKLLVCQNLDTIHWRVTYLLQEQVRRGDVWSAKVEKNSFMEECLRGRPVETRQFTVVGSPGEELRSYLQQNTEESDDEEE